MAYVKSGQNTTWVGSGAEFYTTRPGGHGPCTLLAYANGKSSQAHDKKGEHAVADTSLACTGLATSRVAQEEAVAVASTTWPGMYLEKIL